MLKVICNIDRGQLRSAFLNLIPGPPFSGMKIIPVASRAWRIFFRLDNRASSPFSKRFKVLRPMPARQALASLRNRVGK